MSAENQNTPGSRSVARYLIFPKKQLKYAIFHFLIVSVSVLMVNSFSYFKFTQLLNATTNNVSQLLLAEYTYYISVVSLATLVIMGTISFLLVIVFLHRFVGPIKPLVRHLDEILRGNYQHRTHLRSEDEINEVALKLNDVSAYLEKIESDRNRAS